MILRERNGKSVRVGARILGSVVQPVEQEITVDAGDSTHVGSMAVSAADLDEEPPAMLGASALRGISRSQLDGTR